MAENIIETTPKLNPLTAVTPLSKTLAIILFISLPFLGFYLGIIYQSSLITLSQPSNLNVPPDPSQSRAVFSDLSRQSTPLASAKETANWKTYTNQKFGFSLKYPNTWNEGDRKVEVGDVVVLTPAPVELMGYQIQAVYIQVISNPKHLTSMGYYDQVLKPSQAGSVCTNPLINTNVPTSLKNLDATIIEGTCGVLSQGPRMVVATKDNYIVGISSSFIDKVDNNLIYQILSTFKFLD